MAQILIRDDIMERLTYMANKYGKNLDAVANDILAEALVRNVKTANITDQMSLLERAEAISAMTPVGVKQSDSTILIREDRDQ